MLDAAGSTQTAIVATLDAGQVAMLYAAQHPERVEPRSCSSMHGALLSRRRLPDRGDTRGGGRGRRLPAVHLGNPRLRPCDQPRPHRRPRRDARGGVWARYTVTPRTAAAQYRYFLEHVDVRHALPLIQAPTRVVQVADSFFLPSAHGRYLAEHIAGATYVEIPGGSLSLVANLDIVADEIAELLTGHRPPIEVDRILTTVLFTDIVGSTQRAAAIGDRTGVPSSMITTGRTGSSRDFEGARSTPPAMDSSCRSTDLPVPFGPRPTILQATGEFGIELRAGLHTGECEVRGDDLGGFAVHIAARVDACAAPGEILVSSIVRDLVVGSGSRIPRVRQLRPQRCAAPGASSPCANATLDKAQEVPSHRGHCEDTPVGRQSFELVVTRSLNVIVLP